MEFFCVLSVGGSLASYHVQKKNEEEYRAVLRTNNGRREDIPSQIILHRKENSWQAQPWHDEVVQGLIHAIENK